MRKEHELSENDLGQILSFDAIKAVTSQLVRDYDTQAGRFESLKCWSPYNLITENIASQCGYAVADIRAALTAWRIHRIAKIEMEVKFEIIYEAWLKEMKSEIAKSGYRRKSTEILLGASSFKNVTFLKNHIMARFEAMHLEIFDAHRHDGSIVFVVRTPERSIVAMNILFEVVMRYDGHMRARISFTKYAKLESAIQIDIPFDLMGQIHCAHLEVDRPREIDLHAEHVGRECPNVDRLMDIVAATISYFHDIE